MQTFKLFTKEFIVSTRIESYNSIRRKFENDAAKIQEIFNNRYKQFRNIEDVLRETIKLYDNGMNLCLENAVEILKANGIFDIDVSRFFAYHKKRRDRAGFHDVYDTVEQQYLNIIEDEAEKDAYRTARRQNRGRWEGGGFGLEGAIKGAATAGALNIVSGAAHGVVNLLGKVGSVAGAAIKKSEIFNNPILFPTFSNTVFEDCFDVHYTLVDILRERRIDIGYITQAESTEAKYIFDNLDQTKSNDEILDIIIKILTLDPYEAEYYYLLIKKYLDEDREIETIAEYFGIDVTAYKYRMAKDFLDTQSSSNLRETQEAKENLIQYCASIGGIPKILEEEIDERIYNFKIEETWELYNNLPKETEEEALAAKEKIIVYCGEIGLTENNPVVEKISLVLQEIDKAIRTVDGVEFATREEANFGKDEKHAIESIVKSHDPINRANLLAIISEIQEGDFKTELKDIYTQKYEKALEVFDKKLIKAKRYSYRKTHKRIIYSGDKKDFAIHAGIFLLICILASIEGEIRNIISEIIFYTGIFAAYFILYKFKKERKAWEELTQNGKYDFTDIEN